MSSLCMHEKGDDEGLSTLKREASEGHGIEDSLKGKKNGRRKRFDGLALFFLIVIFIIFILGITFPSPVYYPLLNLVSVCILTLNVFSRMKTSKKWAAGSAVAAAFIFFLVIYQFLNL